jgi:hypothetical protein
VWITQAELARAAGITVQSIFNLERNKLVVSRKGKRGKKDYDVDACVARILADPKGRKKDKIREAYAAWCKGHGRDPYWIKAEAPAEDGEDQEPDENEEADAIPLETSRRRKEFYAAKLEKLKFEQQAGKYIEADIARAAMEDIGIRAQKAMMSIPDRISAMVAAERDPFQVQRILEEEIRGALQSLAADLTRAAPA